MSTKAIGIAKQIANEMCFDQMANEASKSFSVFLKRVKEKYPSLDSTYQEIVVRAFYKFRTIY